MSGPPVDRHAWRSLEPGGPEPPQPAALGPLRDAPLERRDALRLMGASLSLATLAACDEVPEFGHPLHARPRPVEAGDATYATVLELDGLARGVLARTRAGHAVKLEGNPLHPASLGATDVFAEAAVLGLHDPERSRRVRRGGRAAPPEELDRALAAARETLLARGGEGLRIVTGPVSSPTLSRLLGEVLAAFPGARWHRHDPLESPAEAEGLARVRGGGLRALPDLARARAVLCLGADPLGEGPYQLRLAAGWAAGRAEARASGAAPPGLAWAGASPGLTAARADRRLPLPPAELEVLARAVATLLGVPGLAAAAEHPAAGREAAALRAAGPAALVLAGREAGPAVHALAEATNAHLGSEAARLVPSPLAGPAASLAALAADLTSGAATHLLLLGVNPGYDAPAALGLAALLPRASFSLHLGDRVDETAALCLWHAPLAHPLESWGDSLATDGTPAIRQPVTLPLVEAARGEAEVLSALLGAPRPARESVEATWRAAWGGDFESRWAGALEAGVAGPVAGPVSPPPRDGWDRPGPPPAPFSPQALVAVFAPDPHLRAGAEAPLAWLQEMPRPVTRIVWGNAALMAPETAAALGLSRGDEAELELEGRRVLAACWTVAGHAPGCVTLTLGGGRRAGGPVAEGRGFDAYALRPAEGGWVAPGLAVRRTGRRLAVVSTEAHHALEPAEAARVVPPAGALPPPAPGASLHRDWPYPGHAWGMAVDLDSCLGCNACAVACQAENNVPVVGPRAVAEGREMHWLRVDRYHHGPASAPETTFQPVPCMHCEKAPCEPVCPVNATLHDHEGLNLMVYPRCIGTRTCSNNCPYKVRRFNWADHRRRLDTPARNPEVALRPRGVMEKCTYCQHRIAARRADAAAEGRSLARDEVETACQRACPTGAIVFGDLNDPGSAVSLARAEGERGGRHYALLGHLGTRPRTTYLARVSALERGA